MVELALVLPLLLLLAVSLYDYGYYLEHVNNINTVVRDGARAASLTAATPLTADCTDPSWTGSQWACSNSSSSFNTTIAPMVYVEGYLQGEAESLTVPEGGLPLDNVDCCWSSSPSSGTGCPSGSGYTPSVLSQAASSNPTVSIPTSWVVAGAAAAGSPSPSAPTSCISVAYYTSSDGSWSNASLSLCGWWASNSQTSSPSFVANSGNSSCKSLAAPPQPASIPSLVEVTVAYTYTPITPVFNSIFGLRLPIVAYCSMVVEG